jgi:hypothetical protein
MRIASPSWLIWKIWMAFETRTIILKTPIQVTTRMHKMSCYGECCNRKLKTNMAMAIARKYSEDSDSTKIHDWCRGNV